MNRPLIITIGITIVLFVLSVWVYLLVFGTPKETKDIFANLGVIEPSEEIVEIVPANTTSDRSGKLALTGSALQQLTTRAVAGFAFASSSIVRYVERGTGHMYEINLDSGVETQISLTTFPQTVKAIFSPKATEVALISYIQYEQKVSIGAINSDTEQIEVIAFPYNAQNISFADETTVYFTLEEDKKTTGYTYNLEAHSQLKLFTTQLQDIIVWGSDVSGEMYIQTKPTKYLEGYLYTISENVLTAVTSPAYGLTSFINGEYIITSEVKDLSYVSQWLHDDTSTNQPILMIKEKCVFDPIEVAKTWCASPLETNSDYLENWYKGKLTSQDYLWSTSLDAQSSTLIGDLSTLSGRTIDVTDISINTDGAILLFGNKIDQTLWIYRIDGDT